MKHISSKLAVSIISIFCQVNLNLFSFMLKIVDEQLLISDSGFFPDLVKSKY